MNGERQWISCHNYTKEEITKWLELLKRQSGEFHGMRLRKLQHTDYPSIQGPWTPYTFRDPALNLAEFPNEELSRKLHQPPSASDELLEIFKRQQLSDLDNKRAE